MSSRAAIAAALLALAIVAAPSTGKAADPMASALAEAKAAVRRQDWPAVEVALARAEVAAMAATAPVKSADLASIWMIRGVALRAQADPKGRYNDQWRQALVVDNALPWDEALIDDGDAFSLFEALRVEVRGRSASSVGAPPAVGAARLYLDGQRIQAGDTAREGVHLAQVTCPDACTYGAWTTLQSAPDWLGLCPGGVDPAGAAPAEDDEFDGMGPAFGVQPAAATGPSDCAAPRVAATPAPAIGKAGRSSRVAASSAPAAASNRGPVVLMASGGALLAGAVGVNFIKTAPAWAEITAARSAPDALSRAEADALTRNFNVARGLTVGLGTAGLGLGALGLSMHLNPKTSLTPTLSPGGAGLHGRF